MLTFFIVFITVFVAMAVIGVAISWGVETKAELRIWQAKHRQITEAQDHAAWRANRNMTMY